MAPHDQAQLPALGLGITNVVDRATATAAELTAVELVAGGVALRAKVEARRPSVLAVLGVTAYRAAFAAPRAALGPQPDPIGATTVWVLPNPSGLNAHYTPTALAELFTVLRRAVTPEGSGPRG